MKAIELFKNFQKWAKGNITDKYRIENKEMGYQWVYKDLGYTDKLGLEQFQKFFDRKKQNETYVERYNNTDLPSRKSYMWQQNEINMIYSFHKCFAMRNMTRLQYYRNDMSQKGARTHSATNIALAKFLYLSEIQDKKQ